MTPMINTITTENWAKTTRELISQTRRWAVTARGITLGPWQGVLGNSEHFDENARPWIEMVTAAHDRWLDLWESQANAFIDNAVRVSETIKSS